MVLKFCRKLPQAAAKVGILMKTRKFTFDDVGYPFCKEGLHGILKQSI
jgi:hypothetical protein